MDFVLAGNLLRDLTELSYGGVHSFLHTTLDVNRAGAGGYASETVSVDGFGEHGCGRGAVTGHVAGFAGGFTHHLCAHVFERALQLDLLGHSHTIFGGCWGAEFFVDEHVTAFRSEGHRDGPRQFFNTAEDALAGLFVEYELFG